MFYFRCSGDVPTLTPKDFETNLRDTLEEVRKNIPKVFVNLVLLGNISEVSCGAHKSLQDAFLLIISDLQVITKVRVLFEHSSHPSH